MSGAVFHRHRDAQLLIEQHRSATQLGRRIALSVLLFQDLMVVPILFIVGVLSRGADGAALAVVAAFAQAVAAVAVIMVAGSRAFGGGGAGRRGWEESNIRDMGCRFPSHW
ncbi:MAG: hypothetical protein ACREYE_23835 [Gammaproteobacteria bacterium]